MGEREQMKLVVDIPDELYNDLKHEKENGKRHEFYERIIMSGTPLEDVKAEIQINDKHLESVSK